MQDLEIQELLRHAAAEWPVTLQVSVRDRHLHIIVIEADTIDSDLVTLLAEETQTFIPNIDRIVLWLADAAGNPSTQHTTVDMAEPMRPVPVSLTQFQFVRSHLLTVDLPPPPELVVSAVLYVHKLEDSDRLELLDSLGGLFERPDKFRTESVPAAHQDWLNMVQVLKQEWFRAVAVWLSRYCHNPNLALPQLERALAANQSPLPDFDPLPEPVSPIVLPNTKASPETGAQPANPYHEPSMAGRASAGNVAAIARLVDGALTPWRPLTRATIEGPELRLQVSAIHTPGERGTTALIFTALQVFHLPSTITHVKIYGLDANRTIRWSSRLDLEGNHNLAHDFDRFSFDNPILNITAIPLALVIAMMANTIIPILMFPLQIWIHELGHATVAWLAGYRALPLPFGWTSISSDRSTFVYLGIAFLLGLLFVSGKRERKRWPMVLAIVLAVLQAFMTWGLSERSFDLLFVFGGVGGEFYLSTLLIVCFYFKLPDRLRWDFWRFVALFVAASTFCHAFWQWHLIDRGLQDIPWGTMLFGSGDAGGDMNRLNFDHGWSAARIMSTYSRLGELCLMAIIGTYGLFAIKLNGRTWFGMKQKAIVWWLRQGPGRSKQPGLEPTRPDGG
ncbi:MAG: hypothetical protein AAF974_09420 [Cyanobacteria bacterium P01_E01_bin.34]